MFNCSTYYLGLLASKLTAALPFSMRTSGDKDITNDFTILYVRDSIL